MTSEDQWVDGQCAAEFELDNPRPPWLGLGGVGWIELQRRGFELGCSAIGLRGPGERAVVPRDPEAALRGLDRREAVEFRRIRMLGATGTVVMADSALGVGAQPVYQNPLSGVPVAGLFARMPTAMLAMCMIGVVAMALAWLLLGRFVIGGSGSAGRISRGQLEGTLLVWLLPLAVAPPMFSNDVYSYLAQSEIAQRAVGKQKIGPDLRLLVPRGFSPCPSVADRSAGGGALTGCQSTRQERP
ncbi:polyprenol phosphomannose-dependent alpha 1,6 mannosyltransferase MptB [Nocardia sp. NPDC088792]|uniref:polyprenol phosphomannose-dependent alpha 1,6 mannosyltransferase MptB n=1 Tax=Nocardia sp. NPDC088792 TaxID=3364332 RepID=UPI00382731B5